MTRRLLLPTILAALLLPPPAQAAPPPVSFRVVRVETIVQADGTAEVTDHEEIAANNDAAARELAQQTRSYSDALMHVELAEAYTRKPDGTHIPIAPDAVRTQLAPGIPNMPAYSDMKQIIAVLPGVASGDVIVVTWHYQLHHPQFPGHYAAARMFPRTLPWEHADLIFSLPADMTLQLETHDIPFAESQADGRHIYRWQYSAPAVARDPAAVAPIDRVPRLFASSFAGWPDLSRGYAAMFAPQAQVTPEVQKMADQITAGITDRREQARLIYEWVSQHIRWVGIYLGNGLIVPHPAAQVLANGYGDCKDQVALTVALLAAKSITAQPVLLSLYPAYAPVGPAVPEIFNHAITFLPEWDIYADTTATTAAFATLPFQEYGKPALPITQAGAALTRLPLPPPSQDTAKLVITAALSKEGVVTGTSRTEATGAFATTLRQEARNSQAKGAERYISDQLTAVHQSGHGTLAPLDINTMTPGYAMQASFTLDAEPGSLEGDSFAPPTGPRPLARTGDFPLGGINARDLPLSEPAICHAGRMEEDLTLALPKRFHPAHLPHDSDASGSFFHYQSRWSFADGTVAVQRLLVSTIDAPLCAGAQRAEANSAYAAIRRDLEATISLEAGP